MPKVPLIPLIVTLSSSSMYPAVLKGSVATLIVGIVVMVGAGRVPAVPSEVNAVRVPISGI